MINDKPEKETPTIPGRVTIIQNACCMTYKTTNVVETIRQIRSVQDDDDLYTLLVETNGSINYLDLYDLEDWS